MLLVGYPHPTLTYKALCNITTTTVYSSGQGEGPAIVSDDSLGLSILQPANQPIQRPCVLPKTTSVAGEHLQECFHSLNKKSSHRMILILIALDFKVAGMVLVTLPG